MVCGQSPKSNLDLPPPDSKRVRRGVIDGIEVIALPLSYSNYDGVLRRTITFVRYALSSCMLALKLKYDVAFATSTPLTAAIPGIVVRWLRRKPFIFEVRDLWPELPRAMGMKNPLLLGAMWVLEGLAYRSSVACIGLAPGIVEGISRRSPEGHPITMIPNGCDTKLFTPAAKSPLKIPGISSKDFVAGFTGAHGKANGLSILIDVAYRLQQMGRDDIKLLLIGDGAEKPALVKRSQEMGLKNIIFHPPIRKSELASITASLGCGLMLLANIPAFYRGTSPNKFFDYISSGIPVVTNYPGWISEIIVKEEAGVTTPPDNPSRLAEAIVRLCDNPDLCAKMGAAGRILAENVFARDKNASAFADWLEMHAK